jgi:hypothetical protein
LFIWDQSSQENDNGGTIIIPDAKPYRGDGSEILQNMIILMYYGSVRRVMINRIATNHVRIMSAANYAAKTTGKVFIPKGIYQVNQRLYFSDAHNGLTVEGIIAFKHVTASDLPSIQGREKQTEITSRGPPPHKIRIIINFA